jgi:ribonuclease PH
MLTNCYQVCVLPNNESENEESKKNCEPKFFVDVIKSFGIIGSCYAEIGDSKIISSVSMHNLSGKSLLDTGKLSCEVKFVSSLTESDIFNLNEGSKLNSIENSLAQCVSQALNSNINLKLYVKYTIHINILIIQSSLNDLSASINSASLALADAMIEMNDLAVSCVVAYNEIENSSDNDLKSNPTLSINPLSKSNEVTQLFTISYLTELDSIAHLNYSGRFNPIQLFDILQIGKIGCLASREIMRSALEKKY